LQEVGIETEAEGGEMAGVDGPDRFGGVEEGAGGVEEEWQGGIG
jgi:hypothetical protein